MAEQKKKRAREEAEEEKEEKKEKEQKLCSCILHNDTDRIIENVKLEYSNHASYFGKIQPHEEKTIVLDGGESYFLKVKDKGFVFDNGLTQVDVVDGSECHLRIDEV